MNDPFLRRTCTVTRGSEQVAELHIDFERPRLLEADQFLSFEGNVRIHCRFFEETYSARGGDELAVLCWLMTFAEASMSSLQRNGQYQIFWIAEGDLEFSDFWRYRP